jgi:hypothetical protein
MSHEKGRVSFYSKDWRQRSLLGAHLNEISEDKFRE